jgi:hypothetical protein
MDNEIEIDPATGVYEWATRHFTDGEEDNTLHTSGITKIYPFVAGDNVTFIHDTKNQVVKINAAGGSNGLPTYNSNNEGQFLRIVGGTPAWSAIPNAEGVAF